MIHVVITGSRDFPIQKAPTIWEALQEIKNELAAKGWAHHRVVLHHGECPFGGADLIGASWAAGAGWTVKAHPPIEQTGYYYNLRNQEMVDLIPDYVLACYLRGAKNKGTQNTVDMAIASGLRNKLWMVTA